MTACGTCLEGDKLGYARVWWKGTSFFRNQCLLMKSCQMGPLSTKKVNHLLQQWKGSTQEDSRALQWRSQRNVQFIIAGSGNIKKEDVGQGMC
jgi:hypothetical protein